MKEKKETGCPSPISDLLNQSAQIHLENTSAVSLPTDKHGHIDRRIDHTSASADISVAQYIGFLNIVVLASQHIAESIVSFVVFA